MNWVAAGRKTSPVVGMIQTTHHHYRIADATGVKEILIGLLWTVMMMEN